MENEIEQEVHQEEQHHIEKHSDVLENEDIEKNFNLNGKEEQIVLQSENTEILETAVKINNINEDKQELLYTNLNSNEKEQNDNIQIGNILSDESFEKKFISLKDKIKQNKNSLNKLIYFNKRNINLPSPRHTSIKQQSISPTSSKTKKINELFSMIAPLENSNSIPSLPIQGMNNQHHTFIPNYVSINEQTNSLSSVKSTIGPKLITNKNTMDILHKGIANKIEPLISNSLSAYFVTAGDVKNNKYYGYYNKKKGEQSKNEISKTSINLDLGKCFEQRKNKERVYKKDYFLNKLDSFGDKLFGQYNGNGMKRNKGEKRKMLTPATLRESKTTKKNFYDVQKVKNKKENVEKFNRLKLFI